jgi:hypothetical protein
MDLKRYSKEIVEAIRGERYNRFENGIISLFHDGLVIRGEYIEGVNGGDWRRHPNLLVDQGIISSLNVNWGTATKISTWYLAPFAGSSSPAANWTAATFTASATEITSGSEGYSESTRQACAFVNATSADQIDNYASKAAFSIVTASSLTVTGLGLLSVSAKGGTTGVLTSATKFTTARVLQNGDSWLAGYRIALASS